MYDELILSCVYDFVGTDVSSISSLSVEIQEHITLICDLLEIDSTEVTHRFNNICNHIQVCTVCGRLFISNKDRLCSDRCKRVARERSIARDNAKRKKHKEYTWKEIALSGMDRKAMRDYGKAKIL